MGKHIAKGLKSPCECKAGPSVKQEKFLNVFFETFTHWLGREKGS